MKNSQLMSVAHRSDRKTTKNTGNASRASSAGMEPLTLGAKAKPEKIASVYKAEYEKVSTPAKAMQMIFTIAKALRAP